MQFRTVLYKIYHVEDLEHDKFCFKCKNAKHGKCFTWYCKCPLPHCEKSRNKDSLIYELKHRGKTWKENA